MAPYVGWVAAATVLQLARQRGAPALDTLWAEDGRVFLSGSLNDPFLSSLAEPYMGYLLVIPRSLAGLASMLPLGWATFALSLGPAVLVAAVSLYVAFASRSVLPTATSRLVLAAAVVLLPAAGFETLNNTANLQWFLLFGCFWALIHRAGGTVILALECVLIAAIASSAPLAIVFIPMAVGRMLEAPRDALPKLLVLVGVAAVQAVMVLGHGTQAWSTSDIVELPRLFGLRVVGALLVGDALVEEVWGVLGWWLAYLALALLGLFLAWAVARLPVDRRRIFWEALACAVLLFAVPALVRGTEHLAPVGQRFSFAGSRYVVAPMLLLVSMVVIVLQNQAGVRGPARWARRGAAVLAVLLALSGFLVPNLRSLGPRWSDNVAIATEQCRSGRDRVRIPVAPPDPTTWFVEVGCRRVLQIR